MRRGMMGLRMVLSHATSIGVRFPHHVRQNRQGILAVSWPCSGKSGPPMHRGLSPPRPAIAGLMGESLYPGPRDWTRLGRVPEWQYEVLTPYRALSTDPVGRVSVGAGCCGSESKQERRSSARPGASAATRPQCREESFYPSDTAGLCYHRRILLVSQAMNADK